VHVLNVADGNFPSEFSTGRPELIEEERRLLYVAMTRAKADLHLIAPVKYYVVQQSRMGDRHVYGAKSRFLTRNVMACFDEVTWPEGAETAAQEVVSSAPRVDVATRLRDMWS
jgi:DNA helicase-2/ATP-dependent DNA helicase PcrA